MSKVVCPICSNTSAEIRTTKQKANALRKVKPKAFLHCPDCGSLFSNKVSFSNRIQAMLASAQQQVDLSDKQTEKKPIESDNTPPPPPKSGLFTGWGTVL